MRKYVLDVTNKSANQALSMTFENNDEQFQMSPDLPDWVSFFENKK